MGAGWRRLEWGGKSARPPWRRTAAQLAVGGGADRAAALAPRCVGCGSFAVCGRVLQGGPTARRWQETVDRRRLGAGGRRNDDAFEGEDTTTPWWWHPAECQGGTACSQRRRVPRRRRPAPRRAPPGRWGGKRHLSPAWLGFAPTQAACNQREANEGAAVARVEQQSTKQEVK